MNASGNPEFDEASDHSAVDEIKVQPCGQTNSLQPFGYSSVTSISDIPFVRSPKQLCRARVRGCTFRLEETSVCLPNLRLSAWSAACTPTPRCRESEPPPQARIMCHDPRWSSRELVWPADDQELRDVTTQLTMLREHQLEGSSEYCRVLTLIAVCMYDVNTALTNSPAMDPRNVLTRGVLLFTHRTNVTTGSLTLPDIVSSEPMFV